MEIRKTEKESSLDNHTQDDKEFLEGLMIGFDMEQALKELYMDTRSSYDSIVC